MKRGDVVLVQVPFVGSAGAKLRPAVVIQSDALHGMLRETIIAAVTSNLANAHQPHQLLIDISSLDGAGTGLLSNSAVRCERLHTVPQADVRRVIGRLSPALLLRVNDALKAALQIA
jgi:mRNA-degrading endonuclease toxin of MazEF toxin-antitoxin module